VIHLKILSFSFIWGDTNNFRMKILTIGNEGSPDLPGATWYEKRASLYNLALNRE
jgi:hypothetical protein